MSRDPLLFLEDIEKGCEKVIRYTEGRSKHQPPSPVHRQLDVEEQHHGLLFRVIVYDVKRFRKYAMKCVTVFESSRVRSSARFITSIRWPFKQRDDRANSTTTERMEFLQTTTAFH